MFVTPPLKSYLSKDSFVSFWEELNAIGEAEVSTIESQSGLLHEVEAPTSEDSEEAWEDIGSGGSGGGSNELTDFLGVLQKAGELRKTQCCVSHSHVNDLDHF